MSEDKKIELLRDKKKQAFDMWLYSIQRMDLLIISVSGAGIYLCLSTLKYIVEHNLCPCQSIYLKWAGGFLMLSITINFISQMSGKRANFYESRFCDSQLKAQENPTTEQAAEIKLYDNKAEYYSVITRRLNFFSVLTMLIGLIVITIYFCLFF